MEKPFTELLLWSDAALRTPAGHMACDEALLRTAPVPALRLYSWHANSATFGYAQRLRDVRKSTGSLPLARRWTGGGVVFHGSDLTIALAIPHTSHCPHPSRLYEQIHSAILSALRESWPSARLASRRDAIPGPACFTAPAEHDILLGETKLLGGAIRRTRAGILYQGSLQTAFLPTEILAAALAEKTSPWPGPARIEPLATRLSAEKYSTAAWLELR